MNNLSNSTSPYLLQHADNPVNWFPWTEEALAKAQSENKPIFLSIGYAACHWCHVMAHESFEDPETAQLMNEKFINIKVDREERPDLDSIYMAATVALSGSGGWPMSVFLTPDLKPFYAGTYFPPIRRYNMPSFREVLLSLANTWEKEHEKVVETAQKVTANLQQQSILTLDTFELDQGHLDSAVSSLAESYDWNYGGWGNAPKFPQHMTIEYLLRRHVSDNTHALKPALHALKAMVRGGLYDVVGGGFSRYSTDNNWLVPHFEKMLYDNALLISNYLHAWQITKEPLFERIVKESIEFISREMTHPEGGFYSSLDADSEGVEGKFYVWTAEEIKSVLREDYEFFQSAYGFNERGNWEGSIVLQRALDDSTLSTRFQLDIEHVTDKLTVSHSKLLTRRNERIRPATDDKILTSWNGLMLATISEAARVFNGTQAGENYLTMATRNAGFLLNSLRPKRKLRRSWREGKTTDEVFLEDYGALILGLIELYQTDFNNRWFSAALELADEMIKSFSDPQGGFFDTPSEGELLVYKPKDLQDNAIPSGNALACEALLKLSAINSNGLFRTIAENSLNKVAKTVIRYPTSFGRWLSAGDFATAKVKQVAVLGNANDKSFELLIQTLRKNFQPNVVIAASAYPPPKDSPSLLVDRTLVGNKSTAYVCEGFVCLQPVTTPEDLQNQL